MEKNKTENKETSKSSKKSVSKNKLATKKPKKTTPIKQANQQEALKVFDNAFERFRDDFENLLFPSDIDEMLEEVPEVRVPMVDLEDREKDYLLKAEMPGFKKEEIEIVVQDDAVEITGTAGWKYSEKDEDYVCKERACKSFYRYIDLPQDIKIDEVDGKISDGILELMLPKKQPKRTRKISVK